MNETEINRIVDQRVNTKLMTIKQQLQQELGAMTPGINSPLLDPNVSILGYVDPGDLQAQINSLQSQINALTARVEALET